MRLTPTTAPDEGPHAWSADGPCTEHSVGRSLRLSPISTRSVSPHRQVRIGEGWCPTKDVSAQRHGTILRHRDPHQFFNPFTRRKVVYSEPTANRASYTWACCERLDEGTHVLVFSGLVVFERLR